MALPQQWHCRRVVDQGIDENTCAGEPGRADPEQGFTPRLLVAEGNQMVAGDNHGNHCTVAGGGAQGLGHTEHGKERRAVQKDQKVTLRTKEGSGRPEETRRRRIEARSSGRSWRRNLDSGVMECTGKRELGRR